MRDAHPHRVVCVIVTRAGLDMLLERNQPAGDRVLGIDADPEYEGWRAQLLIQEELRRHGRIFAV